MKFRKIQLMKTESECRKDSLKFLKTVIVNNPSEKDALFWDRNHSL